MDDKKAIALLIELMKKDSLSAEERKAIRVALGALSWFSLAESSIKRRGERQKKRNEGGGNFYPHAKRN